MIGLLFYWSNAIEAKTGLGTNEMLVMECFRAPSTVLIGGKSVTHATGSLIKGDADETDVNAAPKMVSRVIWRRVGEGVLFR